jgi:hypothetical protein
MAYEEIQNAIPNWNFLWAETSFATTTIPPTVTDLSTWKEDSFRLYLPADGIATESFLSFVPWNLFRDLYYFGAGHTQTGRPCIVTVKPDNNLLLWPLADDTYTVTAEYYKVPDVLSGNSDVPIFPKHHMIIVWKALMLYAGYASEPDKYALGNDQYKKLYVKLFNTQQQKITWGAPLA